MNFLRGPGDGLLVKQEAGERIRDDRIPHQRDPKLHGNFSAAGAKAGALKIDGRERRLSNGDHISE